MESQVQQPGNNSQSLLTNSGTTRRAIKDKATRIGVSIGGTMVFVALLLIFFYLLYVIKPVFDGASIKESTVVTQQSDISQAKTLMVGSDEQNQVLYKVSTTGHCSIL